METEDIERRYGIGFQAPVLNGSATLERRFVNRWGTPELGRAAWHVLTEAYAQTHRHFHTLRHVDECLQLASQYAAIVGWSEVPLELELALWFHDLVYEPGAKDNERLSAEQFQALAVQAGLKTDVIEGAIALILETTDHKARSVQLSSIMCDCDLWILGNPPERYHEYSRQVRDEYAKYSNWQYRWGRLRFLQEMLKREHVFTNPLFEEAFGALARTNMRSEVKAPNAGRWLCLAG